MDNPFSPSLHSTEDNDGFEKFYNPLAQALELRQIGHNSIELECLVAVEVDEEGNIRSNADIIELDR